MNVSARGTCLWSASCLAPRHNTFVSRTGILIFNWGIEAYARETA